MTDTAGIDFTGAVQVFRIRRGRVVSR